MTTFAFRLSMLALAVSLCACNVNQDAEVPAGVQAEVVPKPLNLDESKLSPLMRFDATQLGAPAQACSDFNGYANGKWLSSNKLPAGHASWGSWTMLGLRSYSVQRQLAEQAAGDLSATGNRKIVADFWASGMDQSRRNALGNKPLQPELDAISALTDAASIADYLRRTAALGGSTPFKFEALADFKDSTTNIAYIQQGGLAFREKRFYLDADMQSFRDA